ncbi:MAG: S8 family serine peptidase [Pseudobdellovibrionaceae bacterium]
MISRMRILFFLPLVLLLACSPKKSPLELFGGEDTGIFSNRPIKQDQFIAIVKLSSPALLTTAQKLEGRTQIDAELAKKIEEEQTKTIEDLKSLSSEIRVLFRYRLVLNGLAIVAPMSLQEQLKSRLHISYVEREGQFGRPITRAVDHKNLLRSFSLAEKNSVKFIGSETVHAAGIRGQGMRVGVIDTGIDFTHSMLGGAGTKEAYEAVNPAKPTEAFPNSKVVGGIDLCGTEYDSASGNYRLHLPVPDENPLDEQGHGSHVAGTIAGVGDGVETYSGVAPEALLYAVKVFGKDGSTGDAVVIAALEYSADPNLDGQPDDQLDVVNLSLGSSYGNPHILYGEAVGNLSNGGTVVVASAGNSGNNDYIVGAPSVANEAISVAASVDDMAHNWQFSTVKFVSSLGEHVVEAIEGPISKPLKEAGDVSGKLVAVGLADQDFSPELAAQVKGNVAFIDRGIVTFGEKIRRAFEAGAIGVVMANNQPSAPIAMGGGPEDKFDIPAVMIPQDLGNTLREEIKQTDVVIHFQNADKVEKPELIDTLTGFSSKGPRSIDGLLKPEISAPGANIISAAMGEGNKGVQMSGTSMAGPHVAGVMALLKQARPDLNSQELKSILMGRAKSIVDETKVNYLLSRQGAGRVQVDASVAAQVVADKVAFSLGEVNIEMQKMVRDSVRVRNISKETLTLNVEMSEATGLKLETPQTLTLVAGESKELALQFRLDVSQLTEKSGELSGLLKLTANGTEVHRIPVLAVAKKISQVEAQALKVHADSAASATGALVKLSLANKGVQDGLALPFNLLGVDARKENVHHDPFMSRACDLQAVGYRIVEKTVGDQKLKVLQIGMKVFEPMTTWNLCELSVLIDADGDEKPEQELAAIQLGNVKGLSTAVNENMFASVLLDATVARKLRSEFEERAIVGPVDGQPVADENYAEAALDLLPLMTFNRSTVHLVEADVTKLARRATGELQIKVAALFNDPNAVEMDDFLASQATQWQPLSLEEKSQAFMNLPEVLEVKAGASVTADLDKGQGKGDLLLLFPDNRTVVSDTESDDQLQILKPVFGN